ncbi:aldo/keto reductase [Knoellia koreensis]|uniref:Aldo/keto reductase n=1 Tax=Knoellia koreensis TaxID=2730921 RepID=A0A849HCC8_9MICO|nr:aldo/keto reductase [Knoellia sp. DB2414S]NNM47396.1 aldo/keto reductase [Knoellia sp. DB2414S]
MNRTRPTLALGCAQLGNLFEAIDDASARELLELAWDTGVRVFDTAPHYGLGLSERRLGNFLATLTPAERAEAVVSTKVGRLLAPTPDRASATDLEAGFDVPATHERVWDASTDGVRRSLEASLVRLGLDRVDTAYLHDPDEYPATERSVETGIAALAELRDEGLVRAVGTGSKSVAAMLTTLDQPATTAMMVAGRHTLIDRSADADLLPRCLRRGTEVAVAGVYNSGLLATPRPSGRFEYAEAPAHVVALAQRVAATCERHGVDLPTAALQFAGRDESVSRVVVGARTPGQLRTNLERWSTAVPESLWDELAGLELIGTTVAT